MAIRCRYPEPSAIYTGYIHTVDEESSQEEDEPNDYDDDSSGNSGGEGNEIFQEDDEMSGEDEDFEVENYGDGDEQMNVEVLDNEEDLWQVITTSGLNLDQYARLVFGLAKKNNDNSVYTRNFIANPDRE